MDISVTIRFEKGYIADPYWPELGKVIDILKESGVNRARTTAARASTLKEYLAGKGMTMDDYKALELRSKRPFNTARDLGLDGDPDEIIIPAHQLYGMLGEGAKFAPSSIRPAKTEQIRTVIKLTDFRTGKTKEDGIWERMSQPKNGAGKPLSNQRTLRANAYIEKFSATGYIHIINPELAGKVRLFFGWLGREIGVGASRKLDWGRYSIEEWTQHA